MYTKERIPSSMNKYNCKAIKYAQLLRIAWHKTSQKCSVAHQHTALILFQIAIWRQAPVIKVVFHPASYTSWQSGLRMQITRSRDCARVLCNLRIWKCATQSRDCANSQIVRNIFMVTAAVLLSCGYIHLGGSDAGHQGSSLSNLIRSRVQPFKVTRYRSSTRTYHIFLNLHLNITIFTWDSQNRCVFF